MVAKERRRQMAKEARVIAIAENVAYLLPCATWSSVFEVGWEKGFHLMVFYMKMLTSIEEFKMLSPKVNNRKSCLRFILV